jgi:hypothetical protein
VESTKPKYALKSPELQAFTDAKQRCTNRRDEKYRSYGGRGIEFKFHDFKEFMDAVGPRPSSDYSLDRIDNDGDYEPSNCKWSTRREQQRNRRRPHAQTMERREPVQLLLALN